MADLIELEEQILAASTGKWTAEVERVKREMVRIAIVAESDPAGALQRAIALLSSLVVPEMTAAAAQGVEDALDFGAVDARLELPESDRVNNVLLPSIEAREAVLGLEDRARMSVETSLSRLRSTSPVKLEDYVASISPITREAANMNAAVTWAVNESRNSAAAQVARAAGRELVWVPERNACLDCTAYAGEVTTGGTFPPGLTFAKSPAVTTALRHPPAHPNCRCEVRPLIAQEYADTLKREAVRSVLRGYALPGDSQKQRIAAAERLLATNPTAPKSVKQYAERAIKRGRFE